MPLSRSRRTTVRPVGPYPTTTARSARVDLRFVAGARVATSRSGGFSSLHKRGCAAAHLSTRGTQPIQDRIEHDRDNRHGDQRVGGFRRQDAEVRPMLDRMNENSPICASATAMASATLKGYPSRRTIDERDQRLADHDDRERRQNRARVPRAGSPATAACRPPRRTARQTRRASAARPTPLAGCNRIGRRRGRRETRRAPSRRRRRRPSRRRCRARASAPSA